MREILQLAWKRFGIITSILGDLQGRVIVTALYFTLLVPFGLGARAFSDPLHRRGKAQWWQRETAASDLDSAKQQG